MSAPLTRQDVIRLATARLLNQGCRAGEHVFGEFECRYRDSHGNACAIGAVIPDDLYERLRCWFDLRYKPVTTLWDESPEFRALFAEDVTSAFLAVVQTNLHDGLPDTPRLFAANLISASRSLLFACDEYDQGRE